jgi:hypothetical protein
MTLYLTCMVEQCAINEQFQGLKIIQFYFYLTTDIIQCLKQFDLN